MATTNQVSILVSAVDEASKVFNKITGSVNDFAKKNEETFKNMRNYGAVAFGGLTAYIYSGVEAMEEYQGMQQRLGHILKTSTGASDKQIASLVAQAEAMEKVGVAGKEQIVTMQSQLATFDMQAESIEALIPSLTDYVIAEKGVNATTEDFKQLTNGMAQALNGNFGALTRSGFVLDEHTKDLISNGTEMERVKAVTEVLQGTYGGFNEAVAQTADGIDILNKRALGDIQEQISGHFIPIMLEVKKAILPIVQGISEWMAVNPELTKYIVMGTLAITGLVAVLGTLGLALPAIGAGLAILTGPIGLIIAGVVALGFAWTNNFLGIQDITKNALDYIKGLWDKYGDDITKKIIDILGQVQAIFIANYLLFQEKTEQALTKIKEFWAVWGSSIKEGFSNVWDTIKIVFRSAIDIITVVLVEGFNIMRGMMNIFKGLFTGDWRLMWEGIKQVFSATWTALKEILSIGLTAITDYIKTVFGVDIKQVFTDMWNNAKEWGGNMIQMFVDGLKEKVQALKDGIAEIATTISDYLGFHSPTKKGPGSDADKWMPNLIKMLASGLQAGGPKIEALAKSLAQKMATMGKKIDMQGLTDGLKNASEKIKSAFSEIDTKIEGSKEKIKGIKDEIKGLTDRLTELTQDRNKAGEEGRLEIANRALDIQKQIEELKAGGITGDEQTKLQSLESEYALAKASVSQEEMKLALMEREKSETQKILDKIVAKQLEIDKEIAKNQQLLAEKQAALVAEEASYKKLVDTKIKMEKDYYSLFQEHIKGVKDGISEAIELMNKLNRLRNGPLLGPAGARAVGGYTSPNTPYLVGERGPEIFMPTGSGRIIPNNEIGGGGGGVTINISGVTISNGMQLEDLTNKIKSVIYNEHKYARLGY